MEQNRCSFQQFSCQFLKLTREILKDEIKTVVKHESDIESWQKSNRHSLEFPIYREFDAVFKMKNSPDDSFHAGAKFLIKTLMVELKVVCCKDYGEWKTGGIVCDSLPGFFRLSRVRLRTNVFIPNKTGANKSIPCKFWDWQVLVSMTTNKILLLKLPSQVWRPPLSFWWKKTKLFLWRRTGLNIEVFQNDSKFSCLISLSWF